MQADPETQALEIRLLLEAIHAKYGYDLREYASPSLQRRVLGALARSGLSHLGELQHRILVDPTYFASVIEDLVVRVSEMFRDPDFYRAFRSQIVPVLRTYPLIKLWHAGCASGEEVYASAILLTEAGLYDRTQIYATDLSPVALEQAKEGTYAVSHLNTFIRNYEQSGGTGRFSSYCTEAYGGFAMNASLRRNVHFFQHDLVSDHPLGDMHVICCRNVLIYFDSDLKGRVLRKLAHSLRPGGFLGLGSSERLLLSGKEGFADFAPDQRIYRYEG